MRAGQLGRQTCVEGARPASTDRWEKAESQKLRALEHAWPATIDMSGSHIFPIHSPVGKSPPQRLISHHPTFCRGLTPSRPHYHEDTIMSTIEAVAEEAKGWRRHIHQNPELLF